MLSRRHSPNSMPQCVYGHALATIHEGPVEEVHLITVCLLTDCMHFRVNLHSLCYSCKHPRDKFSLWKQFTLIACPALQVILLAVSARDVL